MLTNQTSGSWEFQSTESNNLIWEAYGRAGMAQNVVTKELNLSAQRSINLILSSWVNKSVCLWTLKQEMMTIVQGQVVYSLPIATSDVLFCNLRNSIRDLNGIASSSAGGVAQNAFDGNPATACTQTAPNGNIGYTWNGVQYTISMVGVQSNVTADYALTFEYSNDGINWVSVGNEPVKTYTIGQLVWVIMLIPTPGLYFRARETGGATLNIQELYFNTVRQDTVMNRMSYAEWMQINNKNQYPTRPSQYLINRLINPTLTIWPTPSATYNSIFYVRIVMPQDIGTLQNTPDIPSRFFEPLVSELSVILALKNPNFPGDKLQILMGRADEQFRLARTEDRERVTTTITGDYSPMRNGGTR